MKENEQKNSRRKLNSLILLVAFTAILLIVSTYAWFSTQRNVAINGLTGEVKVAEGMQISLDAKSWTSTIDLTGVDLKAAGYNDVQGKGADGTATGDPITNSNLQVSEMQPVSTVGKETAVTDLKMMRGVNTESIKLSDIAAVDVAQTDSSKADYPGYFAFDLFVQNSGINTGDDEGTTTETLQLNTGSSVTVKAAGGNASTGLQNTPRVAFAKFSGTAEITGTNATVGDDERILPITNAATSTIQDVAIWEPNCDKHVANIVASNNYIKWSEADKTTYQITATADANGRTPFADGQTLPTYGLLPAAVGQTIADIYDWSSSTNTNIAKQNVLATKADDDKVNFLKSAADGTTDFEILKNRVTKLRVYVWLEGQDVDTTNYASHGGGITVNIGLTKGQTDTSLLGNTSTPTENNAAHE